MSVLMWVSYAPIDFPRPLEANPLIGFPAITVVVSPMSRQGHPHGLQPQPIIWPYRPRRVNFRSHNCHRGGTLKLSLKQSYPDRRFHRTNRPFWG